MSVFPEETASLVQLLGPLKIQFARCHLAFSLNPSFLHFSGQFDNPATHALFPPLFLSANPGWDSACRLPPASALP